jgi:hypothetical protein
MTKLKYVIKLLGLHFISGSFAMLFCLHVKIWLSFLTEGGSLSSILLTAFAGMAFFVCMMMTIFKAFYVWATNQKETGD